MTTQLLFLIVCVLFSFSSTRLKAEPTKTNTVLEVVNDETFCDNLNLVYENIELLEKLKGTAIEKDALGQERWKCTVQIRSKNGEINGIITKGTYLQRLNSAEYILLEKASEKEAEIKYNEFINLVKGCLIEFGKLEEQTDTPSKKVSIIREDIYGYIEDKYVAIEMVDEVGGWSVKLNVNSTNVK